MLKYCIVALCVLVVAETAVIKSSYAISTAKVSPFGIVEGITSCGSAGQILQVRVTDCTKVPCETVVGRTYAIEIDFKPSASHASLNLKVLLIHQGQSNDIIDGPVPDSEVEAGGTYTFNYNMPISGNFMGSSDLRIEISGDGIVELCGIAGINTVPAPGQKAIVLSSSAVSAKVAPFGVVEGIASCGSAGQILQVRVTDCTRVPCRTVVGRTYAIEIDFIPSASHPSLNLKVLLIHQGEAHVIIDGPVPDSAVEAGSTYTFNYDMSISGNFMGLSDLRIEIAGDEIVELCGIAGIDTVPALSRKVIAISSTAVSAKVAPLGIVEGITSCGSAGTILQVRVTDCTVVPCQTVVGRTYEIEIDFKPSASHPSLNLKVLLIHEGQSHVVVDAPVADSEVEAGNTYTFNYNMPISGNFMGLSDLRIEIAGDEIVELCGIAGINVVPAPGLY